MQCECRSASFICCCHSNVLSLIRIFIVRISMILAGDMIDTSLGVALGISTMCAAAIGNIVSDVAGVMLGAVVEDFCARYLDLPT